MPIAEFKERIDRVIDKLHRAPIAKGPERVYAPGEIEWERRQDALKHGIPLPEPVLGDLLQIREQLGLNTQLLS